MLQSELAGLSPDLLTGIAGDVTLGAVFGFATGYAAKKVAKIIAILVGVQLAVFKFLETRGVLTVNWSRITNPDGAAQVEQQAQTLFMSFISTLPSASGFAGGAVVGFKRG